MTRTSSVILMTVALIGAATPAAATNWSVFNDMPLTRMSKEDAESYKQTIIDTLERGEDGKSVSWQGKGKGTSSTMTPGKRHSDQGQDCREIRLETRAGGRSAAGPYRFCKSASGTWEFKSAAKKSSSGAAPK